jgi:hypothetical protein
MTTLFKRRKKKETEEENSLTGMLISLLCLFMKICFQSFHGQHSTYLAGYGYMINQIFPVPLLWPTSEGIIAVDPTSLCYILKYYMVWNFCQWGAPISLFNKCNCETTLSVFCSFFLYILYAQKLHGINTKDNTFTWICYHFRLNICKNCVQITHMY